MKDNKGTVGFGFRSPVEYSCLKSAYQPHYIDEITEAIRLVLKKDLVLNEPFERNVAGSAYIKVIGNIKDLNGHYLTHEEQEALKLALNEKGFKVKDIS